MRTVGIVCDEADALIKAFNNLSFGGIRLINSDFDKNNDAFADNIMQAEALIAQDAKPALNRVLMELNNDAFLILNADKKEILPFLAKKRGVLKLITYGFNNKSCVTASSTMNGVIQACIQRGFMSLDGRMREPGEFDFPFGETFENTDTDAALGLAAACLVCGVI